MEYNTIWQVRILGIQRNLLAVSQTAVTPHFIFYLFSSRERSKSKFVQIQICGPNPNPQYKAVLTGWLSWTWIWMPLGSLSWSQLSDSEVSVTARSGGLHVFVLFCCRSYVVVLKRTSKNLGGKWKKKLLRYQHCGGGYICCLIFLPLGTLSWLVVG